MKSIYTCIVAIVVSLATGCCTKMDCSVLPTPILNVQLSGFTPAEIERGFVRVYNKATGALLDSMQLIENTSRAFYPEFYTVNSSFPISEAYLVFNVADHSDTVRDINYETSEYKIDCNKCFPGDGRETVTAYHTKSFTYNGSVVTDSDSLMIRK